MNLTRFNLFFPEKRDFFLENAGTFRFGSGCGLGQPGNLVPFFSRHIGLLTNSWIGALVTHHDSTRAGDYNRVFGAAAHFQFFDKPE